MKKQRRKLDEITLDTGRRLVWTRAELCKATGLCVRSMQNLEARGVLERVPIGLATAVYSDASVQALFGAGRKAA